MSLISAGSISLDSTFKGGNQMLRKLVRDNRYVSKTMVRIYHLTQKLFSSLIFFLFKKHNYFQHACISITNDNYESNFKHEFAQITKKFEFVTYVRTKGRIRIRNDYPRSEKTLATKNFVLGQIRRFFMNVSNTPRFTIAYSVP